MSARLRGIAQRTEQIVAAGSYRTPDGREVPIAALTEKVRAGTRMYGPEPVDPGPCSPVRTVFDRTPDAAVRAAFERAFPEGAGRAGQLQP